MPFNREKALAVTERVVYDAYMGGTVERFTREQIVDLYAECVEGFTITPEEQAMLRKVLSRDLRTPPLTPEENRLIDPLHARLGEA